MLCDQLVVFELRLPLSSAQVRGAIFFILTLYTSIKDPHMAEQKTKPTEQTVTSFLEGVTDENVRKDCFALVQLMEKATGFPATMWGAGIIGFGQYHYKYESGHEGYSCLAGFSPRKQNISLYVMNFDNRQALLDKLGKYKAGKGCLYIKKLSDVDGQVLAQLVEASAAYLQKKYPGK